MDFAKLHSSNLGPDLSTLIEYAEFTFKACKSIRSKRARTIILKCLTANISNTHIYLRGQFGYIGDNILLISEYVFKNNKVIQRYGDNIRWISGCILSTKSKRLHILVS